MPRMLHRCASLLVPIAALAACASARRLDDAAVQQLKDAATTEVERQIATDGRVHRFFVFLAADGSVELGGIDGGGNGPFLDGLRLMLERTDFPVGADVTFPGEGVEPIVDSMSMLCIDRTDDHRCDVLQRLPLPVARRDNGDR